MIINHRACGQTSTATSCKSSERQRREVEQQAEGRCTATARAYPVTLWRRRHCSAGSQSPGPHPSLGRRDDEPRPTTQQKAERADHMDRVSVLSTRQIDDRMRVRGRVRGTKKKGKEKSETVKTVRGGARRMTKADSEHASAAARDGGRKETMKKKRKGKKAGAGGRESEAIPPAVD